MSLFTNILEKLGLKKPSKEAASATTAKPAAAPTAKPVSSAMPASKPIAATKPATSVPATPAATPQPERMEMVDVMSKLEKMAAGTGLDWKVSIVDLLKVLDIDSSLAARKELAEELGCPEATMKDNVSMNVWLHKTVLNKIAANGGNLPKELLS